MAVDAARSKAGRASRARGRERELAYRDHLRERGYVCHRIDGAGDLVAGRAGVTWCIQVKSTRDPFQTFGPAERAALSAECALAGWVPALVHWPKGVGVLKARWIPARHWPRPGAAV